MALQYIIQCLICVYCFDLRLEPLDDYDNGIIMHIIRCSAGKRDMLFVFGFLFFAGLEYSIK